VNRHALLALLIALALAAPPAARAYELVSNGVFETASLAGWQTFNQGASGGTGSWYAKSSGNGTYSGLPISPPPAGSWEAVADNSGRVAAILYQDLVIPATTRATLSFTIWHGNAASGNTWTNGSSLSPSTTNQRVRVDLINPATGLLVTSGALQLIYQTATGTAQIVNPTVITADVTALAGQTVRLRFALVATQGGLIAGIDQVKLDVSPFSLHPATLPALYSGDAHWGDFDGDGQFEIAMTGNVDASTRAGYVERYAGGVWQTMATLPAASRGLALGDVNADGALDIGLQGVDIAGASYASVLTNLGGFAFNENDEPIGASNGTIAWGDFDRDGDLDALLTGNLQGTPTTYIGRNDGNGHLTFFNPFVRGVADGDALWANVNAPGIRDIVQTGSGGTDFYLGDGNGGFSPAFAQFIDMANGRVVMGDLNGDGIDEMVIAGRKLSDNTRATKVYGLGMFGWTETMTGLDAVDDASIALGDFDDDGQLDVALMGQTGSGPITRVYHNNGNGTFTDVNANLPGVSAGVIRCADFDGDGDLDLFVTGLDASSHPKSYVAINSTPVVNLAPAPPAALSAVLSETELTLSVGFQGFDDHVASNALTQNFRAGTTSGAGNLIPPMSDAANGRRRVPRAGEAGHGETARLAIDRIGHNQSVWWNAQSVDPCWLGSTWAGEQQFVIGPAITSVTDVPGDQGGHVRLNVQRSPLDDESRVNWPAAGYNVWRLVPPGRVASAVEREGVRVDGAAARARLAASAGREAQAGAARALDLARGAADLSLVEWNGRLFAKSVGKSVVSPFPAGTWEIVASFFALQQPSYLVATTTLADSGVGGVNDQTYLVTMHTTTPSVWFASTPVSGHSVDNIAPAAPVGLSAAYHTGSGNHLSWQPAPETDFESFRVYRGSSPGFTASPASLIASTPNPAYTDPSYDSPVVYYKVSTTDHAGNESAAVAPGSTTAVDGGAAPLAFALAAPSPNPFGEATTLSFTLPRGASARLEVFDASGRHVRTLADGWQPAGEHAVRWSGEDDAGDRVGAGVYFCRLEAGEFKATRRVARMR